MRPSPHAPSIAEQAAEWLMLLTCDDPAERAQGQAGFHAWKAADARHAQAAARIETFVAQVHGVRHAAHGNPRPAHAALDAAFDASLHAANDARRPGRRTALRRVGGALLMVAVLAVPAWFAASVQAPGLLQADIRSAESEWVTRTLPDGTRITLSGASAVKLRYDEHARTVELLGGDIRVDVAKDAARPFYIETPTARIRALGTRFAVSHGNGGSSLEMFESQVVVQPLPLAQDGGTPGTRVGAGERVLITREGLGAIEPIDAQRVEQGLLHHQLVLQQRPLPEVLAQLARHRPGGIRYDSRELAPLLVSGVLPLDKPDEALRLLQGSFPELRLRFAGTRWVWVDAQAGTEKK